MIDEVERLVPTLDASAVVDQGPDPAARHGEFQAGAPLHGPDGEECSGADAARQPRRHSAVRKPFWIRRRRSGTYVKYRRWFGEDLTPTLVIPGAVIATLLTSTAVSFSIDDAHTWNDMAVKGHLPRSRLTVFHGIFENAPADLARVVVLHQNVLSRKISHRMGLSRWKAAQERLIALARRDHQRP